MKKIGGWLDGGMDEGQNVLLVFTVPVHVGFRTIEEAIAKIGEKIKLDAWYYGNVYDHRDGKTPLNWWQEQ